MASDKSLKTDVMFALLAVALFGASTPFAKLLLGQLVPVLQAGLLYAGSGVGLSLWLVLRHWRTPGRNGHVSRWTHCHPHYPDVHPQHEH
ncbi:MAG: hypothetical protein KGI77_05330 [Gammaproteobacteria bacterium]|nr:hypothetical protein [Gammaproteobacteria bacterium]